MSLFAELKRRNVFRVAVAYIVSAWVLAQVVSLAVEAFGAPEWVLKVLITMLAVGMIPALFFSWAFELTPEGLKKESSIADSDSITHHTAKKLDIAVIVLLITAIGLFAGQRMLFAPNETATTADNEAASGAPELSIAVLPFVNMTSDEENEYFADGLSEELLNHLAKIKELRVAGRTSSFHYKGQNEDLRKIGRTLGVANILEGSVRRQGNRVRVTAQLVEADSGFHLWSETFDHTMDDIFLIQDQISRQVTQALQITLLGEAASRTPEVLPIDSESYALYLSARARIHTRIANELLIATDLLQDVTEKAPEFASGWSALAGVALLRHNNDSTLTYDEALAIATPAIRLALALDPDNPEVQSVWGLYNRYVADRTNDEAPREKSRTAYKRALQLDPDHIQTLYWLGMDEMRNDEIDSARPRLQRALTLDPLSPVARNANAVLYFSSGNPDKAEAILRESTRLIPDYNPTYAFLAVIEVHKGSLGAAWLWIEQSLVDAQDIDSIEFLYALSKSLGHQDSMKRALALWKEQPVRVANGGALALVANGDLQGARNILQAAADEEGLWEWGYELGVISAALDDCKPWLAATREYQMELLADPPTIGRNLRIDWATRTAHCLIKTGDKKKGRALAKLAAEDAQKNNSRIWNFNEDFYIVAALALAGDSDAAIAAMENSFENGLYSTNFDGFFDFDEDPVFEPLHDDPRFKDIMKRMRAANAITLAQLKAGEISIEESL